MAPYITGILMSALLIAFPLITAAPADARECTLCIGLATNQAQWPACTDTHPGLGPLAGKETAACLCTVGKNRKIFEGCDEKCAGTNMESGKVCGMFANTAEKETRDAQSCALCTEQATAQAQSPACDDLSAEQTTECLCTAGDNRDIFDGCNSSCSDIPGKKPDNVCAAQKSIIDTADARSCALCWEQAASLAYDPLCIHLGAEDTVKCLCKSGNREIFNGCNYQCHGLHNKQPKNVCKSNVVSGEAPRDAETCELCWETAINQARAPPCSDLDEDEQYKCACKGGNYENTQFCSSDCADTPNRQPEILCHSLGLLPTITTEHISTHVLSISPHLTTAATEPVYNAWTTVLTATESGRSISYLTKSRAAEPQLEDILPYKLSTFSVSHTHPTHTAGHSKRQGWPAYPAWPYYSPNPPAPEDEGKGSYVGWLGLCGAPGAACAFQSPNTTSNSTLSPSRPSQADIHETPTEVHRDIAATPSVSCSIYDDGSFTPVLSCTTITNVALAKRHVGGNYEGRFGHCGVGGQNCRSVVLTSTTFAEVKRDAQQYDGTLRHCGVSGQISCETGSPIILTSTISAEVKRNAQNYEGSLGWCGVNGQACRETGSSVILTPTPQVTPTPTTLFKVARARDFYNFDIDATVVGSPVLPPRAPEEKRALDDTTCVKATVNGNGTSTCKSGARLIFELSRSGKIIARSVMKLFRFLI